MIHKTSAREARMHRDYHAKLFREELHAAWLRARQRRISARLALGRKQLPLKGFEDAA